jgi:hypothetical protein
MTFLQVPIDTLTNLVTTSPSTYYEWQPRIVLLSVVIPTLITVLGSVIGILINRGVFDRKNKYSKTNIRLISDEDKNHLLKHKVFYTLKKLIEVDLYTLFTNCRKSNKEKVFIFLIYVKFTMYLDKLTEYLSDIFKTNINDSKEEHLLNSSIFINNIDYKIKEEWDELNIPEQALNIYDVWTSTRLKWFLPALEHAINSSENYYKEIDSFLDAIWFMTIAELEDAKIKILTFNGELEKLIQPEVMKTIKFEQYKQFYELVI